MSEADLPTEPAALVRHLIEEAANNGNREAVFEVFAESVEPLQETEADSLTPEMLWSNLNDMREALPDMHYEIEDVWHTDDMVFIKYTMTGTLQHDLSVRDVVIDPTGETASIDGIIVTRVEDGRVTAWGNFGQILKGYQELGIVPSFEELAS